MDMTQKGFILVEALRVLAEGQDEEQTPEEFNAWVKRTATDALERSGFTAAE